VRETLCSVHAAPPHFLQIIDERAPFTAPAAGLQLEQHLQPPGFPTMESSRMVRRRIDWEDSPQADDEVLKGHDVASLGPGDSSDTGDDMMGLGREHDTSDRQGTGERMSLDDDPKDRYAADIATDRVVDADGVGLGDGLDQAEEAQLGITDEELAELDGEDAE
jgi:hypothetical protein